MFAERRRRRPGGAGSPFGQFTLNSFQYLIDFTAPSARGGFQTYGNNTNDGRMLRDPNNSVACYIPDANGVMQLQASAGLRRTSKGHSDYPGFGSNVMNLNNRDMTAASWTKTNMTAARSTGADGVTSSGSRLTATAANATVSQAVTLASSTVGWQMDMKRVTGTGTILISPDNGTTTLDVTSQINSGTFTLVFTSKAALANPTGWIQIATSGDAIDVDFTQLATLQGGAILIPPQMRFVTGGSTLFNTQSRPNVAIGDSGPIGPLQQGYFSFFWQGFSERGNGGFILTGSVDIFLSIQADLSVRAAVKTGVAQTPAGAFVTGLGNRNKVAFGFNSAGTIICSCNGQSGSGTTASASVAIDHTDICTNGSSANSTYGFTEKVGWHPNVLLTAAQYNKLTT